MVLSTLVPKTVQIIYLLLHTLLLRISSSQGRSGCLFLQGQFVGWWFRVSVLSTGLLFPPLQFLAPSCLLCTHAILECLHLWLALTPVLVLGHALLHCKVEGSTARAGDQLVQWVFFLIFFLQLSGPVMALWGWSWHLEEPRISTQTRLTYRYDYTHLPAHKQYSPSCTLWPAYMPVSLRD